MHAFRRRSFLREESLVSRSVSRDLPSAANRYWMEIVTEIVNLARARAEWEQKERKGDLDGERTQTRHLVDKRTESTRCASEIRSTFLCKDERARRGDFSRLKRTCFDKNIPLSSFPLRFEATAIYKSYHGRAGFPSCFFFSLLLTLNDRALDSVITYSCCRIVKLCNRNVLLYLRLLSDVVCTCTTCIGGSYILLTKSILRCEL